MNYRYVGAEELEAIEQVIESGQCWRAGLPDQESFVARYEDAVAERTGRSYVHAVCTGSTANQAALAGVGIGPGDEVIVPPCSYIASSLSVVALGAVPVFADVDPRTLHMTAEGLEAAITPNAKAVVAVHLWGMPAEIEPIMQVARRHNLAVIEDCAQAHDVYYRNQLVGTFGDVACYSTMHGKHFSTGEGGLVTTSDPDIYRRAVYYCNAGMPWLLRYGLERPQAQPVNEVPTRGHFAFGSNRRLSELQGAMGLVQVGKLDEFNARRRALVELIEEELAEIQGLRLAPERSDTTPNFWIYPLTLDPAATDLTATEFAQLCQHDYGISPEVYQEVNYLEVVYQQMNQERRTSVGCPLPEYVRYEPGLCPQAEAGARRLLPINCHHGTDPQQLQSLVEAIAQTASDYL